MVLEKTPESPLDSKEILPVILKKINLEYSLEGLMLKLKRQYFGHVMRTANSMGKSLTRAKTEGRMRRWHQRIRWLVGVTDTMDLNLSRLWDMVRNREAWPAAAHGVTKSQTQLGNWKTAAHQLYSSEGVNTGISCNFSSSIPVLGSEMLVMQKEVSVTRFCGSSTGWFGIHFDSVATKMHCCFLILLWNLWDTESPFTKIFPT